MVQRILFARDFKPSQQRLLRAGSECAFDAMQRVLQRLWRQALCLGERRFRERPFVGQQQREAQGVPGLSPIRSDAAASQQQIASSFATSAHDQQAGQS